MVNRGLIKFVVKPENMSIENLLEKIPPYARDIKQNFKKVLTAEGAPGLSNKEIAAVVVAAGMNTRSSEIIKALEEYASQYLSEKEIEGAKTAHALMSMTNVYYRFLHVADNGEYKRMPPNLQMVAKENPGISKKAYELAALGVSAINDCKACVDFHELSLRRLGASAEGIQSGVRIAAVINAVGAVLRSLETP